MLPKALDTLRQHLQANEDTSFNEQLLTEINIIDRILNDSIQSSAFSDLSKYAYYLIGPPPTKCPVCGEAQIDI